MNFIDLTPSDKARAAANAIEHGLDGHTFDMFNFCGTACCVAGHLVALAGKEIPEQYIARLAAEMLELDFMPNEFGMPSCAARKMFMPLPRDGGSIRAIGDNKAWAAAMLRHWAKTRDETGVGVVDWAGTKPVVAT